MPQHFSYNRTMMPKNPMSLHHLLQEVRWWTTRLMQKRPYTRVLRSNLHLDGGRLGPPRQSHHRKPRKLSLSRMILTMMLCSKDLERRKEGDNHTSPIFFSLLSSSSCSGGSYCYFLMKDPTLRPSLLATSMPSTSIFLSATIVTHYSQIGLWCTFTALIMVFHGSILGA